MMMMMIGRLCFLKVFLNFMECLILIRNSLALPLKQTSNPSRGCDILHCRVIKVLHAMIKGGRIFKAVLISQRQSLLGRVQQKCSNPFGFLFYLFLPQLQHRFRYTRLFLVLPSIKRASTFRRIKQSLQKNNGLAKNEIEWDFHSIKGVRVRPDSGYTVSNLITMCIARCYLFQEQTPSWVNICGGSYLFSEHKETWSKSYCTSISSY